MRGQFENAATDIGRRLVILAPVRLVGVNMQISSCPILGNVGGRLNGRGGIIGEPEANFNLDFSVNRIAMVRGRVELPLLHGVSSRLAQSFTRAAECMDVPRQAILLHDQAENNHSLNVGSTRLLGIDGIHSRKNVGRTRAGYRSFGVLSVADRHCGDGVDGDRALRRQETAMQEER